MALGFGGPQSALVGQRPEAGWDWWHFLSRALFSDCAGCPWFHFLIFRTAPVVVVVGVRSSIPILQWERFREGNDALKVTQHSE